MDPDHQSLKNGLADSDRSNRLQDQIAEHDRLEEDMIDTYSKLLIKKYDRLELDLIVGYHKLLCVRKKLVTTLHQTHLSYKYTIKYLNALVQILSIPDNISRVHKKISGVKEKMATNKKLLDQAAADLDAMIGMLDANDALKQLDEAE